MLLLPLGEACRWRWPGAANSRLISQKAAPFAGDGNAPNTDSKGREDYCGSVNQVPPPVQTQGNSIYGNAGGG